MDLPKRKKIRLEGYDYSSCGAYFVTICITNKNALLRNVGADTIRPHNPHTVGADTIRPHNPHTVGADTIRPHNPHTVGADTIRPKPPRTVGADTIRPQPPHTVGADTIRPQPPHTIGADTIRPKPPRTVGADNIRPHNPHTVGADTIRPHNPHTVGADTIRPQPPLSQYGKIVDTAINQIPSHYENVIIDKYCIMPDHIHMIVFIMPNKDGRRTSAPTLPTIIGSMKRWVAKNIGFQIWQKSFNDHIIRNEQAYQEVWKYIDENLMKLDFPGG